MTFIDTIFFHNIAIPIKGRHLVITGKNGAGKTRFLNTLVKELRNDKNTELYTQTILREQISELLKKGINNYPISLGFKNQEIKDINKFRNSYVSENSYKSQLVNIKNLVAKKYVFFNKKKRAYFLKTDHATQYEHLNIDNPNSILEEYYYYNHPHHIDNFHNSLIKLTNNYLEKNKKIEIQPIHHSKNIYHFESSRVKSDQFTLKVFQSFETFKKENPQQHDVEQALEAFLVDKKMAFNALIKFREPQQTIEEPISVRVFDTNEIERWFLKIESDLQTILENPTIELSFTKNGDQVLIIQKDKNISFTFDSLSSGFKAVFNIYANLLVRAQFQDIPPEDLSGIAIIDEIDVHLHISLQKKVLPFLIKAFPKIQFIVSTHSPFVITSTDNDTVVYDISSREFFEEDLSFYSHESIIKELFHVKDESENLKQLSNQLLQFINSENSAQDLNVIQGLVNKINKDFEKLSVELQLQYMVAKNKLAKLKHEGN